MGPRLIEDVQAACSTEGWNVIRTWMHAPDEREALGRRVFEPRESIAETATWLTKLREAVGPGPVLGVDYHHRLSVAEAASFCQRMPRGHARLPGGADPRRDARGLRVAAHDDRRAVRHRRGVRLEVAVPAVHRARHHPVRADRRLQRRRADRGDEGGRLVRGALHRPDAAQPARRDLHRRDGPPGGGRRQLRLDGEPRRRQPRRSASAIRSSSRSRSSRTVRA